MFQIVWEYCFTAKYEVDVMLLMNQRTEHLSLQLKVTTNKTYDGQYRLRHLAPLVTPQQPI